MKTPFLNVVRPTNIKRKQNCTLIYFPPLLWGFDPIPGHAFPLRGLTITLIRRTILVRNPLDERSALRRDLYLTTHNTQNRQTFMPSAVFEPAFPASERQLGSAFYVSSSVFGAWADII